MAPGGNDLGNQCLAAGSPCATVAHALLEAGDGDTVEVAAGAYDQQLVVPAGFAAAGVTVRGADPQSPPSFLQGARFQNSAEVVGLSLEGLRLTYDAEPPPSGRNPVVRFDNGGARTDLSFRRVTIDGQGQNRAGIDGNDLRGELRIEESTFTGLRHWCMVDTDCDGGDSTSSRVERFEFVGNEVSDSSGHVAARGDFSDPVPQRIETVLIEGNSWTDIGPATNLFGAAMKIFYAEDATVVGNSWDGVGSSGFEPPGEAPFGAALDLRRVAEAPGDQAIVADNAFSGAQQGIAVEPANGDTNPPIAPRGAIEGNVFTANAAGIYLPAGTVVPSGLTVSGNRFAGNQVAIHAGAGAGQLPAADNWWGCNLGPAGGAGGCDPIAGAVDASPWLVLRATATPPAVPVGGAASQVVATIDSNSDGAPAGPAPDGTPVSFATGRGSISPPFAELLDGRASAAFASAAEPGPAGVTVTVDAEALAVGLDVSAPPSDPPAQPPAPPPPPPSAPLVEAPPRAGVTVRGAAPAVAILTCASACQVKPAGANVRIGGRSVKVRVKVPASIPAGGSAAVRVVLPRSVRRALADGRSGVVRVRVTLVDALGQAVTRTISVRIRPARKRGG